MPSLSLTCLVSILLTLVSPTAHASPPGNAALEGEAREEAEARYREEALSFREQVTILQRQNKILLVGKRLMVYQGESTQPIEGEELFELLGRDDLVEALGRRRRYAFVAVLGGTAGVIAGLTIFSRGLRTDSRALLATGGILVGAGGAALGGGVALAIANPVSNDELEALVHQYNHELRKQYKLATRIAPYADATGGGLLVSGRF